MKKLFLFLTTALLSTGLWADDCTTLVSFATSQHVTSNPRKVYAYTSTAMTEESQIELICDNSDTKGQNDGAEIRLNYGKYLQIPSQTSVTSVTIDYKFYNSGNTQRTCSLKVAVGSTEKQVLISGLNSDGYKTAEFTFSPAATGEITITNMGSGSSNFHLYLDNITYCTAPACSAPTSPAINGTIAYTEGDNISLTASATGAEDASFTWYKGADWATASAGSSIGSAATLTINECATSDAGTYWCNISNGTGCEVQVSQTITVAAKPVANPIITGAVNEDGWGTVSDAITVTSGDVLSIDGATITCGDYSLTATPAAADAEYTYAFESWSGVSAGAVTTNLTATANFTRTPNTYDVNYTAATNGSYTIKVGEESAVSENTTAAFGQTITLAATPASGYKLGSWKVYKTGDESTEVTVTSNAFTMPAYDVTVSATFVEATVLYDYAVMAAAGNKSFTGEDVTADVGSTQDKTFGTSGNPQLVIEDAGWDKKDNVINTFIKYFGGNKTSMSVVIPANKLATVTISYGSFDANGKYLTVDGVAQAKPIKNLDNSITTSNFDEYMRTVELTNQSGTLELSSNTGNIYIAYVDVAITGTITPTALDNTEVEVKAVKFFKDGMLLIEKNGKIYNAQGQVVR